MSNKPSTFFKFFILLIIITLCIGFSLFLWINRPTGKIPSDGVEFQIKAGDTAHSIATRLSSYEYIRSQELFIIIVRVLNLDKHLKSGWIKINPSNSVVDIVGSIYQGNFITVNFTIPEGSTIKQVRDILVENKIVDTNEIDDLLAEKNLVDIIGLPGFKSAEGFLCPETYKFFKGVTAKAILIEMVNLFYKKLSAIYPSYNNLTREELYRKIIMASIIEREVKLADEASIVAGVFYNRIKTGMKLQSCATVQYILNKPKEQLLESDVLIDNPYNTYLYKGLPPGPICNPGYNAIKAAFYPAVHDYLFFVVSDPEKGSHHFSKTYEEHLKAQKLYKKIKGFY